jgi:hypothetical protein
MEINKQTKGSETYAGTGTVMPALAGIIDGRRSALLRMRLRRGVLRIHDGKEEYMKPAVLKAKW